MKKQGLWKIVLNHLGEVIPFHKVAPSDDRALIMAVHSLEEKLGRERGSLVPYFKKGREENKVEMTFLGEKGEKS
jgi:hypothetical protein